MPKFQLRVTQVFRVQKEIMVEVEANDINEAIETQNESETPDFDDPKWKTDRCELQHEEVELYAPA